MREKVKGERQATNKQTKTLQRKEGGREKCTNEKVARGIMHKRERERERERESKTSNNLPTINHQRASSTATDTKRHKAVWATITLTKCVCV